MPFGLMCEMRRVKKTLEAREATGGETQPITGNSELPEHTLRRWDLQSAKKFLTAEAGQCEGEPERRGGRRGRGKRERQWEK